MGISNVNPVQVTESAGIAPVHRYGQKQSTNLKTDLSETAQPVAQKEKVQDESDPKVSAEEQKAEAVCRVDNPKTKESDEQTEQPVDKVAATPEKKSVDPNHDHRIFMTGKELFNLPVGDEQYLLEGLLPYGNLMLLTGDSDTGKSLFAQNLAQAIVSGAEHFLGLSLKAKRKEVLYISTEDGVIDIARRLQKIIQSTEEGNGSEKITFYFPDGSKKTIDVVTEFLSKHQVDLVIVDVAADIFPGNTNDVSDVRLFFNRFKHLISLYNCSMLFLHHTRKGSAKEAANKDQTLGSMAWTAAPRGVLMLKKESDPFDENARTLTLIKGNYASERLKKQGIPITFDSETLRFSASERKNESSSSGSLTKRTDPKTINAVLQLKDRDLTLAGIVEELRISGVIIGKTTVSEILNDQKKGEAKLDDPTNLLG